MAKKGADRKTPKPNMERLELLKQVVCWQAETNVSYVPDGKRAGTASFVRYERYSKATTVGDALAWGSSGDDLVNDLMKGIMKVTGGPLRERPLDKETLQRGEGLTETDKVIGKFLSYLHRIELVGQLGPEPRKPAKREPLETQAKRFEAQKAAEEVLREVDESGGQVTDEHVLGLLRKWAFRRTAHRRYVMPKDRSVVESEMFGVQRGLTGEWLISQVTRDYPAVTKVLVRWLHDTLPMPGICCTSIHVNSGFAARRHRDRGNLGPSFVRALGDFSEGGQLWYWPEDDGLPDVERLPEERRVSLDLRSAPGVIDGNRAHEVEPFEGERFGIVFYMITDSQKIPKAFADELMSYGFRIPDDEAIEAAGHFFAPPKGYGLEPVEAAAPPKRHKSAVAKRTGQSLLAKLRQKAKQKEEVESGNAGGAKDANKGGVKQAAPKTNLKQAVLKLKSTDDSKGKKTKAGISGGLLARMMAKHSQRVEKEGGKKAAAQAPAESAEKEKTPADGNSVKSGSSEPKPIKVMAGSLMARVLAAKEAKANAAPATLASVPEGSAGKDVHDTPQKKRSNSVAASRSDSSGPPSTKKQKAPGKEDKSSSKAGKPGSEEAKAATEEAKVPSAGPAAAAAPQDGPQPPAATPAPAPPAAAVPTPPAAVAPTLATVVAIPETVKTAAAALGLKPEGREAVACQHFLLLANMLRAIEESPSTTISTLAGYFQVLIRMGEVPELLLRTALDIILPERAAPKEAIEAGVAGAFGAAAGQMAKERGPAEAAQEGRRTKRSLRAPPPRLTLTEVAEAMRGGEEAIVKALGAARAENQETRFLVKVLQGAAGASMGDVHAAVAKAVCA